MANTPKRQDPADDMLAAIEDALKLNEPAAAAKPAPAPEPSAAAKAPAPVPPPSPDEDIFSDFSDRPAPSSRAPRAPREAANDDRPSVGQILASLNQKPSRFPYLIALALSVLWTAGGYYFLDARYSEQLAAAPHSGAIYEQSFFLPIVAAIALPVLGFFVFAALIRRSQEMRYVAAAMTEITMRFAEPENVSSDAFVSIGQAIRREIAALGDGVERAVARASELESMVKSEVSTLERAYDDNEIRIRTLVENLQSERDSVMSHALRLQEAIANSHNAFNFDVEGVSDRVNATITEATNRIIDNFIAQTHSARAHITGAGDEITRNLLDKSQEASDYLNQVGREISNAVAARGIKTIEELQETTDMMSASIAAKGEAIKEVLIARLQQIEDSIILRGSEVADRVMSDSTALGTRITQGLTTFDDTVKVHGSQIVQQIRDSIDKVNKSAETNFTNFDSRLVAKTHELAELLDQRIGRVEKALSDRTQSLNETLASRTLEYARTISEGSKSAQESVEKSVAGMGEYFTAKAQEIAHTISERTDAINQVLGSRALEMTQGLDTRVARFEEMVVSRLEGITSSIEQKSLAAADKLSSKIESTTQQLRDEAASVEKSFTAVAEHVSQTLVARAREVTGAHERLQGDVTGVLERLNDANAMLKNVLAGIVDNLAPIEGVVLDKITGFKNALETTIASTRGAIGHMDGQLRDLRDVSGRVLSDVSALTARFEDQGRFIAGAVDTLSETHTRIDKTLSERREAIEALTTHLSNRSSDLEERLGRFNRILQEQLTAAEDKAQEIAKLVADATSHSTQSIVKQYDLVKNTSNEERERTTAALRATYETATGEVNTLFRDMNQRFTDAARELREVANEVQHSLDQTRQELKRGVFELPHETRESTAAMRRLVADQIKALAELNDIVGRYARNIDHAAPAATRRMAQNAEPPLPPDAAEVRPLPRREFAPSIVEGPRPAPRPAARAEAPLPREEREPRPPRRSEPEDRDEREPRPRRNDREPREERGGAWLNDMLSRVRGGEDDGRRAPDVRADARQDGRAIDSLDALSVDIARLVDHDAAVELWDRYKRGERNVFTRRLYTAQGQKTFEEIRRKYRRSTEFRETVDRYVDEFERLLDQVARDDRGQVLTRTYLTSDTGKVYTLLAHAAGRLG
ncbi:MAG TPA: hypothetical protein VKT73_11905 [Xanthobacteraceae bacterium]|nr:hypothetical protein [Xanthobacteraceae bacterium]